MRVCSHCGLEKPLSEFIRNRAKKNGYNYNCKECQRQSSREHYQRNQSEIRAKTELSRAEAIRRNTQIIEDYLKEHPCVDCGFSNPIALDFDHVRGVKLGSISEMKKDGWSPETLIEEIAKCEIRCANCHRIRHHNARQYVSMV